MSERIDKVLASAIDRIDRVSDRWQMTKAKICLDIASRILTLNRKIFNRMVEYAAVIVEAEEGAKI